MIIMYYEAIDKDRWVDILRVGGNAFALYEDGRKATFRWEKGNYMDRNHNILPLHNSNTLYTTPVGLEMLKMKYPYLRDYL